MILFLRNKTYNCFLKVPCLSILKYYAINPCSDLRVSRFFVHILN